ncbi:cathepsin L1-like [Drosophila novamexicana]|uniref:cathepsin L1-like n=1 Tax=Drosophila novamexicana TaxID=47314 RepID=UPI0011E5CCF9|nr:cathepsin L1-like [Drosophila novamexicana]
MRAVVTFLTIVGCVQVTLNEDVFEVEWNNFKVDYKKIYQHISEDQLRKQIFKHNKEIIDRHNERYAAGEETFEMGVNQFTDLLSHEFETLILGGLNATVDETEIDLIYSPTGNVEIPSTVDWREKGAVTRVKDQGYCGSCWAFAAVGTLEGQHYRKTGELVELSEKNLLDCTSGEPYYNHGCHGGRTTTALYYVERNHGIDTASSYPYKDKKGHCRFDRRYIGATVSSIVRIRPHCESALAEAVATEGPIAVSIEATHLHHYRGGVLRKSCHKRSNHAVVVVGYGHDTHGGDYWLVKNSWGNLYGEDGYVRMARNQNNMCFIASNAVYPLA